MSYKDEFIARIKEVVDPMIYKAEDGFDVIEFSGVGFWTSDSLRVVADYLDERNKEWQDSIDEYFRQNPVTKEIEIDID